jgi:pyruvate formate lyase activating enzyme
MGGRAEPADISGVIFDLQRFSVHDGPGIRSLVFLKGCPLRCPWCANPESQRFQPELMLDGSRCIACGGCLAVCPTGAAHRTEDGIAQDAGRCAGCGRCAETCYADARAMAGRRVRAGEVLAEVVRDEPFFRNSGGGVTLGGGEPLAQPDFAAAILQLCRARGLHTAVETCGQAPWAACEAVRPWTHLFLFDLKHIHAERHRAVTGADLARILENLGRLAAAARVVVRVPLIPGFNDEPDTVSALAQRARAAGVSEVHLLPYHGFGQSKYAQLGRAYAFAGAAAVPPAKLEALRAAAAATGVRVEVGGKPHSP